MSDRQWVDVTERALYLRAIPVTANLPQEVVHAVARHLTDRELTVGEALLSEGCDARALQLVTQGKLGLFKGGKRIGEIVPPQSVGFLNLIARNEAPYDAIVEVPGRSLELTGERLNELLEDHYPLLLSTLRYAAERLFYEMGELPAAALGLKPEVMPIPIPSRPLDLVERVLVLRSMSAFRRTNVSTVAVLAEQMSELRLASGSTIFTVGEPSTFTIFLLEGSVRCTTLDGCSFSYGPGTAVGGVEAIAAKDRWYTAVAEGEVVALRGYGEHVLDVMEDDFELGADFASAVAGGLSAILAAKAAQGQAAFAQKRDVSKLGAVPVGA